MIESKIERFAVLVTARCPGGIGLAASGRFAELEMGQSDYCEDWLVDGPPSDPGIYVWVGSAYCHTHDPDCEPRFTGKWRSVLVTEAWALMHGRTLWEESPATA